MMTTSKLGVCLWFDHEAEEAALHYTSIFKQSRMKNVARFGTEGQEIHGKAPGSAMTVEFELDGQSFTALNGGPMFKFNEAMSLQVYCDTQEDVDYYWDKLAEGGDERAQRCGWLKDKFGVSWQVIPISLPQYVNGSDPRRAQQATRAMLQMKKLDLNKLKEAYEAD